MVFLPVYFLPRNIFAFPRSGLDLKTAEEDYENGRYAKAETTLLELLKKNPKNIRARNLLTAVYFAQKKYDQSIRQMEEILKQNPRDFRTLYNLVVLLSSLYRYDEIKSLLEKYEPFKGLADNKQKAYFYFMLAKSYRNQTTKVTETTKRSDIEWGIKERWRYCLEYLPISIKLNPKNAEAYALLAKVQIEIGCSWIDSGEKESGNRYLNLAKQNLDQALKLKSEFKDALKSMDTYNRCREKLEKAEFKPTD